MKVIQIGAFAGGQNLFLDGEQIPLESGQAQIAKNCSVIDNVLRTVAAPTLLLSNLTSATITHFARVGSGETSADFFATDISGFNGINYEYRKNAKRAAKRFYASQQNYSYLILNAETGLVGSQYEVCRAVPAEPETSATATGLTATFQYCITWFDRFGFESPISPIVEYEATNDTVVIGSVATGKNPGDVDTNGFWNVYRAEKGSGTGFSFLQTVLGTLTSFNDNISTTAGALGDPPTTVGYDYHPCPGGFNPIYQLGSGDWRMPPPLTVTTGNVTETDPEYCWTATRSAVDESGTSVQLETSPSPVYRLDGSVSSKKVEFPIDLTNSNKDLSVGYTYLRLYNAAPDVNALGRVWRLVDQQAVAASVTLTHNTDPSSYTLNDNPYMKNGMDGCLYHNNIMIGWIGRDLYWSEVGEPHLWKPDTWTVKLKSRIYHAISFFSEVIVLTDSGLYRIQINNPEDISVDEIPNSDVALYKSAAASPQGVFVVKDGLSLYSNGVLRNVSNNAVKESDFASDGFGIWHNGFYYYFSPTSNGIIADTRSGTPIFRSTTVTASAAYSDPTNGKLYLATGNDIYTWPSEYAPSGSDLELTWKSPILSPAGPQIKKDFRRFSLEYTGTGRIKWYVNGTLSSTTNLTTHASRANRSYYLPPATIGERLEYQIDNFSSDGTTKNSLIVYAGEIQFATKGSA